MKILKQMPLFMLLVISFIIVSVLALIGRDTVYADYPYDPMDTPALAIVFQGAMEGVFPGEIFQQVSVVFAQKADEITDEILSAEAVNETVGESVNESANEIEIEILDAQGVVSNQGMESEPESEPEEELERLPFEVVTQEYFDDALFIGDSRTEGLRLYSGWENATFYSETGLTIYTLLDREIIPVEGQKNKISVRQALTENSFRKIYIMVGINELGRGTVDMFGEEYAKVLEEIRQLQPEAIIFVEGIMRVSEAKAESDEIFNNTNINIRNANISAFDNGRTVFYIDVNEAICDENGSLRSQYSFDGVHLKAEYIGIWKEFLLNHGIVSEE